MSLRAEGEDGATECSEQGVAGAVAMTGVVDACNEAGKDGVGDGLGDAHGDPSSSGWPVALWPLSSDMVLTN